MENLSFSKALPGDPAQASHTSPRSVFCCCLNSSAPTPPGPISCWQLHRSLLQRLVQTQHPAPAVSRLIAAPFCSSGLLHLSLPLSFQSAITPHQDGREPHSWARCQGCHLQNLDSAKVRQPGSGPVPERGSCCWGPRSPGTPRGEPHLSTTRLSPEAPSSPRWPQQRPSQGKKCVLCRAVGCSRFCPRRGWRWGSAANPDSSHSTKLIVFLFHNSVLF